MEKTKALLDHCKKSQGGYCPHCGSGDTELRWSGEGRRYEMQAIFHCNTCRRDYTLIYTLDRVEVE